MTIELTIEKCCSSLARSWPPVPVTEILKSQLAIQQNMWNNCRADFWEFSLMLAKPEVPLPVEEIVKRQLFSYSFSPLSVLQCVAVCCTLQQTATDCNRLQQTATDCNTMQHTATHCNILNGLHEELKLSKHQLFSYSFGPLNVLQCVAVCVAVCCSVLQCVAVCCSVLQCVAFIQFIHSVHSVASWLLRISARWKFNGLCKITFGTVKWAEHSSLRARVQRSRKWVMSHMNGHVTYEFVMSHMNALCLMWMSRVIYEFIMSHIIASCLIWMSRVTYEFVISHMNVSCHIWMSHATYEWVMSHMNASCLTWMSRVTHEFVMSHIKLSIQEILQNSELGIRKILKNQLWSHSTAWQGVLMNCLQSCETVCEGMYVCVCVERERESAWVERERHFLLHCA